MDRREFLKHSGLGAAALASGCATGTPPRKAERLPNIVYLLADDLGYGDVSYFNPDSKIPTPNIDKLGQEGMAFTDMHSGSAVCTPTRYGIMTGRYSWRTRLERWVFQVFDTPLIPQERLTVASLLRAKGYRTACIGKWHLGLDWATRDGAPQNKENVDFNKPFKGGPLDLGFDYYFGIPASLDMEPYVYLEQDRAEAAPTEPDPGGKGLAFHRPGLAAPGFSADGVLPRLTEKAVARIGEHARSHAEKPFFLYFPLSAPHAPILPSAEFKGKSPVGPYGDFVMQTDWVVGQVRQALEQHSMLENTLFVFTSDNGCSGAADFEALARYDHHPSYHFRGQKAQLFEGGHRIPFIVRWPGRVTPASVCHDLGCLGDLMATVADLTGTRLPDNAGEDSISILPSMLGRTGKPQRQAIVHHSTNGDFAIREGEWKLLLCSGSGSGGRKEREAALAAGNPTIQLYNLREDIGERWNMAAKYPEIADRLTRLLREYVEHGRSTPGRPQKNNRAVDILNAPTA